VVMQAFPHHYAVVARAEMQSDVALEGERLPPIASAPPTEFGGPGDRWSFRAIAGASRFPWISLACDVVGTVDRVDRVTQFTAIEVRARLRVPQGANEGQAHPC
jgi:hypothetical protein